jgi:quercetin dioxygenase-like cupin family protein
MLTANVHELDLAEVRAEGDPTLGCRFAFPIYAATGAAASGVVYFEVEPGGRLGRHTDSAEEVILVLDGEAEAEVDGERERLGQGGLALVPAMAPHDVRNVGAGPLRMVGFFAGAALVHRFFEYLPGAEEAVFVHGPRGAEALAAAPVGGQSTASDGIGTRDRGRDPNDIPRRNALGTGH